MPNHPALPGSSNTAVASAIAPGTAAIAIVNESTVLNDAQVQAVLPSLGTQIIRDFAPIWHRTAALTFYSSAAKVSIPATSWWIVVADNSDIAKALGYHQLSPAGAPLAQVFAKTVMDAGQSWTVTLSHELLEMLVNPYVGDYAFAQSSDTAGTLYPKEIGDPVEADGLGSRINNVLVSDWVTPQWFDGWRTPGSARFDFGNHLTQPLQLAPGGYVETYAATGNGFTQTTARHELSTPRIAKGSRQELRAVPADQRRVSVPTLQT